MVQSDKTSTDSLLLLVAGAKGAVASTLAVALAAREDLSRPLIHVAVLVFLLMFRLPAVKKALSKLRQLPGRI